MGRLELGSGLEVVRFRFKAVFPQGKPQMERDIKFKKLFSLVNFFSLIFFLHCVLFPVVWSCICSSSCFRCSLFLTLHCCYLFFTLHCFSRYVTIACFSPCVPVTHSSFCIAIV